VDVSASEAATIGDTANASVNRTAASAATGVTTAGQSEASAGRLSNELTGEVSGHDAASTKPSLGPRPGHAADQTKPAKPADSQIAPKRRPETGENSSLEPNAKEKASTGGGGEMTGTTSDANASASLNASATS
jgi:hypothetical protein